MEHVLELGERPGIREDDAPLHELGEALHALRNEEGAHVRLLEVVVGAVDDERDHAGDFVLELGREILIALFGEDQGQPRDRLFLGIVENLDVIALQGQPVEILVLNLVFPEGVVLRCGRRCDGKYECRCESYE